MAPSARGDGDDRAHPRPQRQRGIGKLGKSDPHRNALYHLDEVSGGVVRRQQGELGAGGGAQALHATAERHARIGIDGDGGLVAGLHLADLGLLIGDDLYQREVDFLKRSEWATTVEDIIWRRTKLGLRLSPVEIERLSAYLSETACSPAIKRARS